MKPVHALLVLHVGCLAVDAPGALVPPTVDQDPALPSFPVEVDGVTRLVHGRVFGDPDAPTLLVLHGSLGDHRAFLGFEPLAERYQVVMWDQRGNGLSERIGPDEYQLDDVLDEIGAVKDRFSPDRPVTLVGHSFGAMYAAAYTDRRPDDVAELALLEPGGLTGEVMEATFGDIIEVDLLGAPLTSMLWQSEVLSPDDHAAIDQRALLYLLDSTADYFCDPEDPPPLPVWRPGGVVDTLRGDVLGRRGFTFSYDFARTLSSWPGEVLLVGGSCSALDADFQRRWHAPLLREPTIVELPGVGHRMPSEATEQVLDVLRGWLREYAGR